MDLYLRWKTENADLKVTTFGGGVYSWKSPIYYNISSGLHNFNFEIPYASNYIRAMWIFQDMRRVREFYLTNTYPYVDPGRLTVHWEKDQNEEWPCSTSCFKGTHVFMADSSAISSSLVVHELGHHVMFNQTGQWFIIPDCFDHDIFSIETQECAWYEGWADFFALAVNNDECYDKGIGPCTGTINHDYYNLEYHSRNDNYMEFPWDDVVEG